MSEGAASLDGATIAVADDDVAMRQLLATVLRSLGCRVNEYPSGDELIEELSSTSARPPDLIISDVRMAGLGGFDVLHWRAREMPDVPVILITAFGDERTHRRGEELGAACVIDKPFDLVDLGRSVTAVLSETPS